MCYRWISHILSIVTFRQWYYDSIVHIHHTYYNDNIIYMDISKRDDWFSGSLCEINNNSNNNIASRATPNYCARMRYEIQQFRILIIMYPREKKRGLKVAIRWQLDTLFLLYIISHLLIESPITRFVFQQNSTLFLFNSGRTTLDHQNLKFGLCITIHVFA